MTDTQDTTDQRARPRCYAPDGGEEFDRSTCMIFEGGDGRPCPRGLCRMSRLKGALPGGIPVPCNRCDSDDDQACDHDDDEAEPDIATPPAPVPVSVGSTWKEKVSDRVVRVVGVDTHVVCGADRTRVAIRNVDGDRLSYVNAATFRPRFEPAEPAPVPVDKGVDDDIQHELAEVLWRGHVELKTNAYVVADALLERFNVSRKEGR